MKRLRTIIVSISALLCCQASTAQNAVDSLKKSALLDVESMVDSKQAKKPGEHTKDAINKLVENIKAASAGAEKSTPDDKTAEAYVKAIEESITAIDKKIEEAKAALPIVAAKQQEVDTVRKEKQTMSDQVDACELLCLKVVNDFLKGESPKGKYSKEGLEEAKGLLARVSGNSMKNDLQPLVENYECWLAEIADICANALDDCSNPNQKMAWKNPNNSRAYVFTAQLDNCAYIRRADKNWKIPYFDELIANAKRRILMYKEKQRQPMTFDDILPEEYLPKKEEAKVEAVSADETGSQPLVNSSNLQPSHPVTITSSTASDTTPEINTK